MTTESLSVTIEGELLTVEIGTVAAPAGGGGGSAAWGDITGTLAAQTDLQSALDLKAPLASPTLTGTPAAPTAAGATSTTQIATTAFVGGEITTHAGATDPHGDRSFATSAVSTHSGLTTGAHGITAAGAALLDDATAADQRTTLGLGTAATTAATAYEASGAIATHNAVTTAHGISAFGATLVNDADAATARGTLGLDTAATAATGDFEAAGSIATHAALTTSVHGITAAGAALIDDADAAAQRTTLGLGTAATTAATDYATAAQGTDDRTASGLRTASTVVSVSAATAPTSGQVLTATSTTAATWQTPSGGGSPGGSTTQLQYNNAGAFAGMSGTAWDDTNRAETRTGATVTTSNPVQSFTQTWNAGAVTFTGWKLNVTDTASATASVLMDLQVGGSSKFKVAKNGAVTIANSGGNASYVLTDNGAGSYTNVFGDSINYLVIRAATANNNIFLNGSGANGPGITVASGLNIAWASSATNAVNAQDLTLNRDAADTLAQKRGTNAQTSRIYGTYTDSSNYVRASLAATSTAVTLTAETAGTGADDVPVSVVPAGAAGVILGASGAGSANSVQHYNKSVTGIADATATAVLTVTVPNAAHSASIEVILNGSLGAGGAIGANEAMGTVIYNISIARTAGVNAVATISTAYGSSTSAVAGAATITVTGDLGAVSGAVGAANTFTIRATITKGSGASANHTCVATARVLNANASGITIA